MARGAHSAWAREAGGAGLIDRVLLLGSGGMGASLCALSLNACRAVPCGAVSRLWYGHGRRGAIGQFVRAYTSRRLLLVSASTRFFADMSPGGYKIRKRNYIYENRICDRHRRLRCCCCRCLRRRCDRTWHERVSARSAITKSRKIVLKLSKY